MSRDVRTRVLVVLGLAALGIALAVTGSALGVGDDTLQGSEGPAVKIDEDVTVVDDDSEVVVVENVSTVETVTVQADDGERIRFETKSRDDETVERERAIRIARANETVRQAIEALDEPELTVEPAVRMNATESESVAVSGASTNSHNGSGGAGTDTFTVNVSEDASRDGVVVVQTRRIDPSDLATVRIADARGEIRYTARIDLETETVTGFTAR